MTKAEQADSERSRRGYDRLAPIYEGLEHLAFGSALMRARLALLPNLPPLERALVLGEGDGRFLRALLKSQARCKVTCVEQSAAMVQRAHARLSNSPLLERVNFTIQDASSFKPEKRSYDAIFTTFFLDCFSEAQLAERLPLWLKGLKRGGLWYYTDFHQPSSGFAALRAAAYLRSMHRFFTWQTGLEPDALVDTRPLFAANGLTLAVEQSSSKQLLTTKIYRYA